MPSAIGFRNAFKSGIITAASQTSALPATNLAGDICAPSTAWQTRTGDTSAPQAVLRITASVPASVWRMFGLFRTNLTSNATVTIAAFISIAGGAPTQVFTATIVGVKPGYGQIVVVAPSDVVADYVTFSINDPTNPDSFINVGGAYAGPAWIPDRGISWSSSIGRDQAVTKVTSRGGQDYPVLQWQKRRWDIGFDGIKSAEMWTQVDALRIIARSGVNVLFIPNAASIDILFEALFGMLADTADITFPGKSADVRAWRASLTERL